MNTSPATANAAIYYHPEGFKTDGKRLMGRHAAGEGFLEHFARHAQAEKLYAFSATREHFNEFCAQVKDLASTRQAAWVPHAAPERLAEPGALFVPGPGLGEQAWHRRCVDRFAYSLTGVTHTVCTGRVMDALGELLVAPTEPWDAVICTSEAVRTAVENVVRGYAGYLHERLGCPAPRFVPQLPVIPLGVDCDRFERSTADETLRRRLRRQFKVDEGGIAVLFFGRLSFHAKANPLPMYLALEAVGRATGKKITLIQAGWFANDAIRNAFTQGARALCPSVNLAFADGRLPEVRTDVWAAADIFCSLSDNIQETFGLTPVEAMAAGLPLIVTEWNGYRGTVRHDESGFMVPTLMPPPGCGEDLVYRYATGADSYDQYIGNVSQSTAVDIGAVTRAFQALVENAELRRTMGAAGRARARAVFDWRVVVEQYQALWGELAERRRAAAGNGETKRRPAPLRADPYAVYSHYPSRLLEPDAVIRLAVEEPHKVLRRRGGLAIQNYARHALAADAAVTGFIKRLQQRDGMTVEEALAGASERPIMHRTLGWLLKLGVIQCAPE